jgi:hypothetical protein
MAALEKGITRNGTGYSGKTWNILGQVYFPKAVTDSIAFYEGIVAAGGWPALGTTSLKPGSKGENVAALIRRLQVGKAGDLVRLPRGIPHGYFNKSDKPARALFWVSPTQKLEALFNQLHNLSDVAEIVRISAEHEVNFLPPESIV